MKSISKKIITCATLAIMVVALSISVFAAAPSGAVQWKGDVDFWTTKVGTKVKNNTTTTSYQSFTGAPYSMNLWLTGRRNDNDVLVSAKTKFAKGNEKNVSTGAAKDQNIKLVAARENILDTKVACTGWWLP